MQQKNPLSPPLSEDLLQKNIYAEPTQIMRIFRGFITRDVAAGDAAKDTRRAYDTHARAWLGWCRARGINPLRVEPEDVKRYRREMVEANVARNTAALKLAVVSRLYEAVVEAGLRPDNPAARVRPPKNRRAEAETARVLSDQEAIDLLDAVRRETDLLVRGRNLALVHLLLYEGLRSVEIMRACMEDIEELPGGAIRILVHGKGHDGYIYPRGDTAEAIREYLQLRKQPYIPDSSGTPLFVALDSRCRDRRLTRDGVRHIVNRLMAEAGIKRMGRACHALRHTCGTLLYRATKDLRVVQETLRHATPTMAARYAHILDRGEQAHTSLIELRGTSSQPPVED
jgi:integrase/recombinase XerC/integrase/recombinase XerD